MSHLSQAAHYAEFDAMKSVRTFLIGLFVALVCSGCYGDFPNTGEAGQEEPEDIGVLGPEAGSVFDRAAMLQSAQTWMYQIQDLDSPGMLEALAATDYPLLVLEPTWTEQGMEDLDARRMIEVLRWRPDGAPRLLLAYIDIGEAEDYRIYWRDDWRPPSADGPGFPDYIITLDPDGWSGNYPVAYWDPRWQAIWLGDNGLVTRLAKDGFDGVYLDWVEAYDDDAVRRAALEQGVDPEMGMLWFIEAIREAGQSVTPDFLIVVQNAPYLLDVDPDYYAEIVDALAMEDTWFQGEGDAAWDDPTGGDIPNSYTDEWSTESLLVQYQEYLALDIPVFTVDYCLDPGNASLVYRQARRYGLRPLVTRVSLSRLTETPPAD